MSQLYERILVPTDGSEGAENAAIGAIALSSSMDATLETLHVMALPDVPSSYEKEFQQAVRTRATEIVSSVEALGTDRGVTVESTILSTKDPEHEVIIHYANEHDIDCIVMGTTGRSGLRRLALGSVAERTVRGAPVPVITMHAEATFPESLDRVLVPTDGSDGARAAVDHAIDVASAYDASLHIMHAVDVNPMARAETASLYDSLEAIGEEAIDEARAEAREAGLRSIEASVVSGKPDEAIVDYIDQRDIDAVVMGTHGRTGLRRLWLGSVSERVIRQSSAPVIAVKPTAAREQLPTPNPVVSTE